MFKNKIFLMTFSFILLIVCLYLLYILYETTNERDVLADELAGSQDTVNLLHHKITELLEDIHELTFDYELLQANEYVLTIHSEKIESLSNPNWFIPDVIPIKGDFAISQGFSDAHVAVDFSTSPGKHVHASAAGIVIVCYDNKYLGNMVMIDHLNSYKTLYAHLDRFSVSINDFVEKGQIIGVVGNTGYSTNPHLHFQIYHQNDPTDPSLYMNITGFQN